MTTVESTKAAESTVPLRGWSATIAAVLLILTELIVLAIVSAPTPLAVIPGSILTTAISPIVLLGQPISDFAVSPQTAMTAFVLLLGLVVFSFSTSLDLWSLVWRTFATAAFAAPVAVLVLRIPDSPATYAFVLSILLGEALWFLDRTVRVSTPWRPVLVAYGGLWITLIVDAIGRHTPLDFAKKIPLHPALGAFNDIRALLIGAIVILWIVGAFLSTVWDEHKRWAAPLTNPFLPDATTGRWGGIYDGLHWAGHHAFVVVEIGVRLLANARMLVTCYGRHLWHDYIKQVFEKGYLLPAFRFILSAAVITGVVFGARAISPVLVTYLGYPSPSAEFLFGPQVAVGSHGAIAQEVLVLFEAAAFILTFSCCSVFQAWNWRIGGPDAVARVVKVVAVIVVTFAATGIIATILAWSDLRLVSPALRYPGIVSVVALCAMVISMAIAARQSRRTAGANARAMP